MLQYVSSGGQQGINFILMGGSSSSKTHPLAANWQRLNADFLRNRVTHELIQQHVVVLPSEREQIAHTAVLRKRFSLQHPHIVRIIYFKNENRMCQCSQEANDHQNVLFTEYPGDCLRDLVDQNCPHHQPHPFLYNLVNAFEYLHDQYGPFRVHPGMVFLASKGQEDPVRGEKVVKVWMHPQIEICNPQQACSEAEMVASLLSLVKYLGENRICEVRQTTDYSGFDGNIRALREVVMRNHTSGSRVQANRILTDSNRGYEESDLFLDIGGKRKHQEQPLQSINHLPFHPVKAQSDRPVTFQQPPTHQAHLQSHQILFYHPPNNASAQVPQVINSAYPKYGTEQPLNYRLHNHHSMKVNFVYDKSTNYAQSMAQSNGVHVARAKNHTFHVERKAQAPTYSQPTHHQVVRPKPVISTQKRPLGHIGTQTTSQQVSLVNSPVRVKPSPFKQPPTKQHNINARQMHIALKENSVSKQSKNKMPTTSRSPQRFKQSQPVANIIEQQSVSSHHKSKKSQNNNKFQRYKKAIEEYERRVKEKNSKNPKNKNRPKTYQPGQPLRKKRSSKVEKTESNHECKETQSVYNDSGEDMVSHVEKTEESQPPIIIVSPSPEEPKVDDSYEDLPDNLPEEQSPKRRKKSQAELEQELISFKEPPVMIKTVSLEYEDGHEERAMQELQRMKEMQEKVLLQQELQKQKTLIKNEMQGLLSDKAIKEQYRNIRQKVKQKKANFAQLKAEAAKILEDMNL